MRITITSTREGGPQREQVDKEYRKAWTPSSVRQLRTLAKGNTPTRVIALKLGRTPAAIYSKAAEKQISLAPPNQRPYGGRKRK